MGYGVRCDGDVWGSGGDGWNVDVGLGGMGVCGVGSGGMRLGYECKGNVRWAGLGWAGERRWEYEDLNHDKMDREFTSVLPVLPVLWLKKVCVKEYS